ncbi:MAG: hypothetical protein Q8L48_31750 [Archangium sp.]|nr:hypothetical protein [Archangium sp.]
MNQQGGQGKSAVFWVLLAAGGTCAMCSVLTAGVMFLGLFSVDDSNLTPVRPASAHGLIPTGNTPNLYPGSPGWLPSGRGVQIPEPEVFDGRPMGLWWRYTVLSDGKTMGAVMTLFLEDGTMAVHPRPGGRVLFDIEGQRAQPGSTGVGTFEVEDGRFTQHLGGYDSSDTFESGSDGDGPYFKVGAAKYAALSPPTPGQLVGAWKSPRGKFVVNEDGTFELGNVIFNEDSVVAGGSKGTWVLDGFLLQLSPPDAPSWISLVGMSGSLLVMGQTVYSRQ